jgi:hypothetical protein
MVAKNRTAHICGAYRGRNGPFFKRTFLTRLEAAVYRFDEACVDSYYGSRSCKTSICETLIENVAGLEADITASPRSGADLGWSAQVMTGAIRSRTMIGGQSLRTIRAPDERLEKWRRYRVSFLGPSHQIAPIRLGSILLSGRDHFMVPGRTG